MPADKYHNAVHVVWPATGSPVGVFSVETSSDSGDTKDAVTIDNKRAPTPAQPSDGNAGGTVLEFDTAELYARVKYTRTSGGTGATATITLSGKL